MPKRLNKFEYNDFKDPKKLDKLHSEIYSFIKKRCKTDDVGDLPVTCMLRSRSLHYPFNDCFLIPVGEKEIDTAIDLQMCNLSTAMSRLEMLFKLKSLYSREKK